jgi:2'-hydroxyisoflavone reductase
MDILLLGGPQFVGRHIIELAQMEGHRVTMLNRGTTNPELFGDVERLVADRNGDLSVLAGRSWDAVIDSSGYVPRTVRAAATALRGRVGAYVFVSTTGVYAETGRIGCAEDAPLRRLADETDDLQTEDDITFYGALKVLCEQEVSAAFGERGVLLRPGPIVGPHDPTDRFTYGPRRGAAGGRAIVPGPPERLVQHIDVRDLARVAISMAGDPVGGPLNVVAEPYRFDSFLNACAAVTSGEVTWMWAPSDWLLAEGVIAPWELPVWLPGDDNRGRLACDGSRLHELGFTTRPLRETAADTLAWDASRPRPLHRGPVGDRYRVIPLEPEREAQLLRRLDAGASAGR